MTAETDTTALERRDVVALDDVTYGYPGGPNVIEGLSLGLAPGEIVCVVGPSGCGKTTLLTMLAGLAKPRSGAVRWSPDPAKPARHPLTMMFQKDTLLPWMTTEDNISLHFRLSGTQLRRADKAGRIADLVELAGLKGAEKKYPYQLSGGMRRRVAFLAAVASRPRVLLLDEPFSALDEPTRIAIHQDIFDIVKSQGISVVLVTHDIGEAVSLADRIIVLTARPGTIYATHHTPFGEQRDITRIRQHPDFLSLYARLWEQLEVQVDSARKSSSSFDPDLGPHAEDGGPR